MSSNTKPKPLKPILKKQTQNSSKDTKKKTSTSPKHLSEVRNLDSMSGKTGMIPGGFMSGGPRLNPSGVTGAWQSNMQQQAPQHNTNANPNSKRVSGRSNGATYGGSVAPTYSGGGQTDNDKPRRRKCKSFTFCLLILSLLYKSSFLHVMCWRLWNTLLIVKQLNQVGYARKGKRTRCILGMNLTRIEYLRTGNLCWSRCEILRRGIGSFGGRMMTEVSD